MILHKFEIMNFAKIATLHHAQEREKRKKANTFTLLGNHLRRVAEFTLKETLDRWESTIEQENLPRLVNTFMTYSSFVS